MHQNLMLYNIARWVEPPFLMKNGRKWHSLRYHFNSWEGTFETLIITTSIGGIKEDNQIGQSLSYTGWFVNNGPPFIQNLSCFGLFYAKVMKICHIGLVKVILLPCWKLLWHTWFRNYIRKRKVKYISKFTQMIKSPIEYVGCQVFRSRPYHWNYL